MLGPARAAEALAERAERHAILMDEDHRRRDEALADGSVPRLFVIEAEYALVLMQTERDWVLALADEIGDGQLAWPRADTNKVHPACGFSPGSRDRRRGLRD